MKRYGDSLKAGLAERKVNTASAPVVVPAAKQMIAYQIEREMAHQHFTRQEMAKKMNTSRAALNRLLDPQNDSVTLNTIQKAAEILGLNLIVTFNKRELA